MNWTPPPLITADPMTGRETTVTVPLLFNALVYQASPDGNGGKITFANAPL
jgi:hypothetical protein